MHDRSQKFGKTKCGEQRFRCLDCRKTYVDSTRTLGGMRIGTDKAAQIIRCLMEGMGVRSAARLANVSTNTLMDLLVLIGERCKLFMEATVINVPAKDISVDELWSFLSCKERTRVLRSRQAGTCGDQYCFVGLDKETRLVLAWHAGQRTPLDGSRFIRKMRRACASDVCQISSDGWRSYKTIIPGEFPKADYGMVIKLFGNMQDTGRYSPGRIIEMKLKPIAGNPDKSRMNTSLSERLNLSIRMGLRRFTRLTNGFSKKFENHEAALALFFAYHNFCQKHGTLKKTPAVAAGLTDHQWTVEELIERTASYCPPTPFEAFINSLPDDE